MRLPSGETCGFALSGLPNSVLRGISSTAVVLVIGTPLVKIFKPGHYFFGNGKFKCLTQLLEVLWYIPGCDRSEPFHKCRRFVLCFVHILPLPLYSCMCYLYYHISPEQEKRQPYSLFRRKC